MPLLTGERKANVGFQYFYLGSPYVAKAFKNRALNSHFTLIIKYHRTSIGMLKCVYQYDIEYFLKIEII